MSKGLGYRIDPDKADQIQTSVFDEGFKNADIRLTDGQLLTNIQAVQKRQNLPLSQMLYLKKFSKSLRRQCLGICNYAKHKLTSARIEAGNIAIGMIRKRARGIRDTEYFKLKIRQTSLPDLITHQFQLSRLISNRRKNNGLHWLFHRIASLHCQIWPKSTLVCIIKNLGLPMSAGLDATKLGCLAAEDGG